MGGGDLLAAGMEGKEIGETLRRLLELVLDVGGELLFSRKKGEQGKPEGQPSVPDGGRRQQKTAFQPGKDPWEYQVKKPPWEK